MHHCITYICISTFNKIGLVDQSNTVRTNIFANNCKLHKFAIIPIVFFSQFLRTCIIIKRTCISIFSKIGFVDQSKPCTQIYLQKIASCINLQQLIVILKKLIIRDMRYRKTYMYINF